MAYYDRFGVDVEDEAVACTEEVTINAGTYYRGRARQVAGLSVLGDTSALYGVWTAVEQGGDRLTVVAAPGVPADADEVAWDCVAGWLYSTTSRTVYASYRGHGSFSPTQADFDVLVGDIGDIEDELADCVRGPVDLSPGATVTDLALAVWDGTSGRSITDFSATVGFAPGGAPMINCGAFAAQSVDAGGYYYDDALLPVGNIPNQNVGTGGSPTFVAATLGAGTVSSGGLMIGTGARIYSPTTNQVGLACANVLRLLATTSGAEVTGTLGVSSVVGAGTTSPNTSGAMRLHAVNGAGAIPSLSANTLALFQRNAATGDSVVATLLAGTTGTSSLQFGDTDVAAAGFINYEHTNNRFRFRTNANSATETLMDSSGNWEFPARITPVNFRLPAGGGTPPASAGAAGTAGDVRWDADHLYICTATDTWKRADIDTW